MKNLSSKDHFEAVYLKHRDFYKINELPPERRDVSHLECDHMFTVKVQARKFFDKHSTLLKKIGMEFEDILCISRVHLYKYLVLFSLKNNPEKLAEFVKKYKERHGETSYPTINDITKKDISNFMCYLPQKLSDLLRFCNVKLPSITGEKQMKVVFELPNNIDNSVSDMFILENYKKIGARRLYLKEIAALKRNGADLTIGHIVHNGKIYRSILFKEYRAIQDVGLENKHLDDIDGRVANIYTPFTSDYETLLESKDAEEKSFKIDEMVASYKKMDKKSKAAYLNETIRVAENAKNAEVVRLAKTLLQSL